MATDLERLVVQLSADVKGFNRELQKAVGTSNRQARSIERRFKQMNRNLSSGFAGVGASMARAFAVAGGLRGMQTLLDSATRIDNALKVAGLSGEELEKVYSRLRDSAIRNAAPIDTLVTLYGRAALVQRELNVSQEEMLNFTDKIAVALRVAGTDAQSASGALLQLSQALGSGVVRAEEFNSILEGALPIAQAAAAGLDEAGGSVARLRQLVVEGKVSSEAFFRAFEAGASILDEKVAGATLTTQQGLTNINTALIDAMRDFARGTMAAETLGDAFGMMAEKINSIDFAAFGQQVRELLGLINQIREALGWIQNMGTTIGKTLGTDAIGDWLTGGKGHQSFFGGALTITNQRGLQRRFDEVFSGAVETASELTEDAIRRAASNTASSAAKGDRLPTGGVKPVSLADFAAPSKEGGKGQRERINEYERLSQRIRENIETLNAERSVMEKLNPLVDDYGYAVEKARAQQELLNAAKRAGLTIDDSLTLQIEQLSEAYAAATVEAAKLTELQDNIRKQAQEMADFNKQLFRGIVDGFIEGKNAADVFADALQNIGNKLLDLAFDSLFSGGGSGGGLLGGLLSGLFGGFRESGGPVQSGRAYVVGEKRPELFVPQQNGVIIPKIPKSISSGGGSVTYAPVIDARGASPEAVARLESILAQDKASFEARVVKTVNQASRNRMIQ